MSGSTATSGVFGGNIIDDGGASLTERGIVYAVTSTNNNPVIGGVGVVKNTNGSGVGVFSESISGLTANTGYSYASYAINSEVTFYGAVKTFTTAALVSLTITFANINKTYGDASFALNATSNSAGTISYAIVGAANGTSLSGANNKDISIGNAGTLTIRATQAADGVYDEGTKDITLTIAQAALTVTADSGFSKVYGVVDPTLTYTINGFVNGDVESDLDSGVSISRASGENVANYVVTPASAADSNYSVSFVTTTFGIFYWKFNKSSRRRCKCLCNFTRRCSE